MFFHVPNGFPVVVWFYAWDGGRRSVEVGGGCFLSLSRVRVSFGLLGWA